MRLSRSVSFSKQRKNKKLGSNSRARKKHKRLDAICEKAYSRNHSLLESESTECNVGGGSIANESELRRSSRARRAPVLLDASPPPPKKRLKIDKGSGIGSAESTRRKEWVKSESPCSTSRDLEEESGNWRSRLRSRPNNVSFRVRGRGVGDSSPKGKRKLFEESDGFKDGPKLEVGELNDKNEGFGGGKLTVVKSHRPGKIKASNVLRNEHQEVGSGSFVEDLKEKNEVDLLEDKDGSSLLLDSGVKGGNEGEVKDNMASMELVVEKESEPPTGLHLEEYVVNDNGQSMENVNVVEQPDNADEVENQKDASAVDGAPSHQAEDGRSLEKPLEGDISEKVDKLNYTSTDALGKPRIKKGRRCGLCGGGTDGKPPKVLVQDGAGSDNEAYCGSSASEEPNYDMWDGFGDEPGWLGRLLGPINDRFGIAGIWVHQHCAVWSPEVYFAGLGCLKNVRAALCRGRLLKCNRCGRRGATIGCRVDRCPKTYHLPCARANGCIFDHRKFLIACTDHRNLFQPHGSGYFYRLKKLKARKMKMEIRKMSNDAWKKDVEAEEKWLENCGEDEEFLKRESKRLHRDLLRIAPVYIGGSKSDNEIQFQGWESVAGLKDVIQCLKEVVILPLLYPEFFSNIGLTPPRGVLLHGHPGTGKTLVVRSLIGSCARGDKRIAYFARKGADCLGKYVGDAERQLRLLFQVAEKSQPSIIFFDEIDGLAPSRTRQQDQTHSSVVSTLLALLDGLKSRGSVVVIGATNRPDAVDPALRRPGRFDREIYFPLPSVMDREAILSLHTQKWPKPVTGSLLKWIARRTAGFAGADLQALCTQAAIVALKRSCPLQKLLSEAGGKSQLGKRPPLPFFNVLERDWLEALSCAPPPCSRREAGMAANDVVSSPLPAHLIPCVLQPLSTLLLSLHLDERTWLPPPLSKAATLIKTVILSALNKKKIRSESWWSHVHGLLQEADVADEIASNLSRSSILVGDAYFVGSDALDEDAGYDNSTVGLSSLQHFGTHSNLLQNVSPLANKSGFRILLSGNPRSGQNHLASCILHCFVGNVEIRKVDLATISQEGHGDVVQGVTQILMRCASVGSCIVFMPRIDLWAVEMCYQEESDCSATGVEFPDENRFSLEHSDVDEEKKSCPNKHKSAELAEPKDAILKASHLWTSFMEQVESIRLSTSLIILATSEMSFPLLPLRIRQFFESDTLNCNLSAPLKDTVPRFSILVDGNFNSDMVIDSSAAKLSKDLVHYFVQLIYHRTHISAGSGKEDKASDAVESDANTVCHNCEPGLAVNPLCLKQCPVSPVLRVSLPSGTINMKGKSSLMLAISTFGYQILQYPHFAELCWVTSKLKEGPCADIDGPWKGWPFNSCIIRPKDSLEKENLAAEWISSNIKSNRKFGLVRGLIAVGLLAYRGMYTTLREVSSEVRKVLELLAGQVHAKIEAGKDRYHFGRLLSQVAYLEDVVNSWAYMLRSLEVQGQVTEADPRLACMESLDKFNICDANLVQGDQCNTDVTNKSLHVLESLEGSPQKLNATNTGCVPLIGDDDSGQPNCEGRVATVEEPSQHVSFNLSSPAIHFESSDATDNPLHTELLNAENGVNTAPCSLESYRNIMKVTEVFRSISNGYACTDSVGLPKDGPCGSGGLGSVKFSNGGKDGNRDNLLSSAEMNRPSEDGNPNFCERTIDVNPSLNSVADLPTDPGVVCLYRCCSECLIKLQHLVQRNLIYQRGLKGSKWSVEDVHDVVTSLSVHLHSEVRNFCLAESSVRSLGKNVDHLNYKKLFEGQENGICQCKKSGNRLIMPKECSCHPRVRSTTAKESSSWNPHELELIYRDGVLIAVEPEKDISLHCKFETLCLCSLIEWIVMTKQPSD